MRITIDYLQGTNGAYLEYIGNVFLIPTLPFHNPFDQLDRAHNKKYNPDICVFACGHYYLYGVPDSTHVIGINITPKDYIRLEKIMMHKFGNISAIHPPRFAESTFLFNWASMFSTPTFIHELDSLCKYLNIKFTVNQPLLEIHSEFLSRHQYAL
jgi:hypothetical protein